MNRCALLCALLAVTSAVADEVVFTETFTDWAADRAPFSITWGDQPEAVEANQVVSADGASAATFRARFGARAEKHLCYLTYRLERPIPLVDGLRQIQVELKSNVPVLLKVGLSPFGFIYHATSQPPSDQFGTLVRDDVAGELQAWCRRGQRDPAGASISSLILALGKTDHVTAELAVRRITVTGADGTAAGLAAEQLRRRAAAVRVAAVSMLWSPAERTVAKALEWVTIAHHQGADLVALPMECVDTEGEPIPGPSSEAFSAKAKELGIWIVANHRETDAGQTFVTSYLLNRQGELVGKYRKSHKLPDEDFALGEQLPVFDTEFGKVALKIGSDRFFPEIDHCYAAQGASLICWAQAPEPLEDEHLQDRPVPGLAIDYRQTYLCSRYASVKPGYITDRYPTYLGRPIGRSYVVNREGLRVACTPRTGGGVALATLPVNTLGGERRPGTAPGFRMLGDDSPAPPRPTYAKRRIKVAAIDSHLPLETLLARLDDCGRLGCDVACTYEFVWLPIPGRAGGLTDQQMQAKREQVRGWREQVAAKAKQYGMYVLLAGVIDRLETNEAILYDRQGEEVWRYTKIATTYPEQVPGTTVPVYDTDFGRLGVWICADENLVEIPRCVAVQGADLLFTPTQSWGPDSTHRDDRDISRAMLGGFFLVEATDPSSEPTHNSRVINPCGAVVAMSGYYRSGLCVAELELDQDRPRRYARSWTPREIQGYLPEYQTDRVPQETNDLFDVVRQQRRPELYRRILFPTE